MRSHPSQKIGRNDRCPCGSGKKFKHCCLRSGHSAEQLKDTPWKLQNEASQRLTSEFMRFAKSRFADDFPLAWEDFNQESFPPPLDKFPGEEQIFMPFFLFDWDPDRPPRSRAKSRKPGIIARAFLEERASRVGNLELAILHLSITTPLSFYEVLHVEPGFGMRLRDIFIGGETDVEEHSASRTVQVGHILYGQLCRLPEITALSRLAPTPIRPGRKAELINLRAWMRHKITKQKRELAEEDLVRYEEKIRTQYLNARDSAHTPPTLVNTDGELLLLHTMRFRVGSAQVAFDALASLASGSTKEDLLASAEVDPDGTLRSAKIEWIKPGNAMHKDWDNTILGHLKIEGNTLTVDVNSAARAQKIREEIQNRLGMLAKHLDTTTHSQEKMRETARSNRAQRDGGNSGPDMKHHDPEAQKALKAMLASHMESWIDTKIPALGGRTPRQAAVDEDGREILDGLLQDWEQQNKNSGDPLMQSMDVGAIRKKLGL